VPHDPDLHNNPLLRLFLVAAVGYPFGRIKIGGSSLIGSEGMEVEQA
jgi:hypothetical protein